MKTKKRTWTLVVVIALLMQSSVYRGLSATCEDESTSEAIAQSSQLTHEMIDLSHNNHKSIFFHDQNGHTSHHDCASTSGIAICSLASTPDLPPPPLTNPTWVALIYTFDHYSNPYRPPIIT